MMMQLKRVVAIGALCVAACGDGDDVPEVPGNGMMDAGAADASMDARASEGGLADTGVVDSD